MHLEVYPDIIFLLNFTVDFVLLFLLKKINRRKSGIKSLLLAAAIGGAAAAVTGIFPWMNIIVRFLLLNIGCSLLMLLIAFGRMKPAELLKQMITLYLITYFVGGLINSVYYHTNLRLYLLRLGNSLIFSNLSWKFVIITVLLVIPIIFLLLLYSRWYQSNIRETLDIELDWGDRSVRTKGLLDSGNCLYDPIFRKPVIIMEDTLLKKLLPTEVYQAFGKVKSCVTDYAVSKEKWDTDYEKLLHPRIIPYQSVGKANGLMPGLVLDRVVIYKGKETICNDKVTAAICDNRLSATEEYHVILHKGLL